MQNDLTIFQFNQVQVRTATINAEPWWVARDVCAILGLKNVSQATISLDDDEKTVITNDTPLGGYQEMLFVNESGLYSLILKSRRKEAKEFKRWITHEILPTIRKTGGYAIAPREPISEIDRLAQIVGVSYQRTEAQLHDLNGKVAALENKTEKMNPLEVAKQAETQMVHRRMETSQHKRMIRSHLVPTIVQAARKQAGHHAAEWDNFQKVWSKLHAAVGLNKFDDYMTVEVCQSAIAFLEGVLKSLGGDPQRALFGEAG